MNNGNARNCDRPLSLDINTPHPSDYAHRYRMDLTDSDDTCKIKEIFGMLVFTLSVLCFALGVYLI
ncbi:hypothetical protein [Desulfovibrio ferrophilus]|uniref:Envelope glycoprotein gp160 n=1 Tax=Desulfovibrio ferrophilus TaxID=241368 RepID=A0A2Z6AZF3_9BACT|nr:hypothetical protein [Desulfovibrio ferrophilus]BBD08598.1 envelope glycoprotein gp160 [Desulfovibrio ferrophilus]